MRLDISKWKEFKVASIFTIHNGKGITKDEIEENEGDFTVVQSGEENNGVLGKINLEYCKSMNYTISTSPCLTVARSGSAGYVSFQKNGCVVGDSAKILLLDEKIADIEIYIFLQCVLSANRFKYAYGRKVTETKYMNDYIMLPIKRNEDGTPTMDDSKRYSNNGWIPDWEYMKKFIKTLKYKPITTKNPISQKANIEVDKWYGFRFGNLISDIYKAKAINKDELTQTDTFKGSICYITRTSENNGCECRALLEDVNPGYIEKGNAISIGDTTATCFYQAEQFITGDHMVIVRADWLNRINAMFIVTLLSREQYKYSYGRAFLMDRIKDTLIKLPIKRNEDGTPVINYNKKYSKKGYLPDWDYIETYIKSLPYGDRL